MASVLEPAMDKEKFRQLYEAARNAHLVTGDDLSARAKARRQLRQTLDLLSVEAEVYQWTAIGWARHNDFPEFDRLERQFPDL